MGTLFFIIDDLPVEPTLARPDALVDDAAVLPDVAAPEDPVLLVVTSPV
jgi:hypothetical protein